MEIALGSFLIQILAFALLFLLLKKYAFGPLVKVMVQRQENIREQINMAEKNRQEAEKLLKEQNEAIQKARVEAHEIVERARVNSVKQADEIIETARREAERIKEQAIQEIQHEREKAVEALREQVGTLSVLLASKIIEKELDVKEQSKLIDDFMKQVGESL
ncbi:F0F1 ATP synthase subunit B [Tepidibacillus fermentans]|uniref:ATP synthase subunit b n=1 Tax=Tepidibacillus fermentans TaxID=1281767 RepID=A0A4R3KJ92_9BACI|nr:F0F1 ATP synthase subunit B [Tepidibacillus fermentans]TCS83407.1 ATP synthase F0 subcomplex B subunit [Tepidibacillus fermentans]